MKTNQQQEDKDAKLLNSLVWTGIKHEPKTNQPAVTGEGNAPREDYKSERGSAAWWAKDGAWHIALPATNRFGRREMLWTADQYDSREAAIAAIKKV